MTTVRLARPEDLHAVLKLEQAWADEGVTLGQVAPTLAELTSALGPYFVVAECEGAIVGFAFGSVQTSEGLAISPVGERFLSVEDLYVRAEDRDEGIGGRLLDRLLETARGAGIGKCLVFSATRDVRRVLAFYERHGFASWGIQLVRAP